MCVDELCGKQTKPELLVYSSEQHIIKKRKKKNPEKSIKKFTETRSSKTLADETFTRLDKKIHSKYAK